RTGRFAPFSVATKHTAMVSHTGRTTGTMTKMTPSLVSPRSPSDEHAAGCDDRSGAGNPPCPRSAGRLHAGTAGTRGRGAADGQEPVASNRPPRSRLRQRHRTVADCARRLRTPHPGAPRCRQAWRWTVSETGATQDEVDDATRDEFDDICDENMRLRRALDVAREALERLEKLPCQ